jgi:hypothetical protein
VAGIRWVCLSDTHFGAENSLLSFVPAGSNVVDADTSGPVLESLVECLRAVVSTGSASHPPTLILNGDILEFALAQDNVAAMVFDRFIDLAFATGQPIFDPTIVYLPGNHDHHLWETARERQYARYVATVDPAEELEPPWHVTRLIRDPETPPLEAELLTALVQRRTGPALTVEIVYPNLAVSSAAGDRTVLFHHGHFVEPLYRLFSEIRGTMFPKQPRGVEIWDWEADNFAWIDFFWSTLGRSGEAGEDVGVIYDMLQSPAAVSSLAGNLGARLGAKAPHWLSPAIRPLASEVFRRLARLVADRERSRPSGLLSDSAELGLANFVSGPLRRQLAREAPGRTKDPCHFVFGHTHKPFERAQSFSGFAQPVSVYNTGGWVVDTEQTASLQGASIVVVDDECHVAALRLYNQADQAGAYKARLAPPVGQTPNPLHAHLESALDFSAAPWTQLSATISEAVDHRHQLLPRIIEQGLALT